MADFHFLRPGWLLALIPLALFYWRLLLQQKHQSGWHQWLPKHLATVLVASGGKPHSLWSAHRLGLFWLIGCLALAGPTWERMPQPVYQLETGQVVIVDMSPSVLAEDIQPNRLTQLRFKAMDLVKSGLDGDTGLIAYADDAFTISPLTADNNNLLNLIPSLSPAIMPRSGSEPLRALKLADELLRNAGYLEGDIYWLTDGIASSELNALSRYLRQQPHRVSILGVGSEAGAPIRQSDGSLMTDARGQTIIAKLIPSRLADLAHISGGIYQTVQADNSDITAFVEQPPLNREGKDGDAQQQGDQWRDNGPYLVLLLLPIMLFSWRRGGSLGSWLPLALLPLTLFNAPPALAQQNSSTQWWLNQEQQAQQLLQQQQFEAAAELSSDPLRQGAAQYRQGDFAAAADSFAQVDSATGWYNRGNALAQQQRFGAARDAYQQALQKRPGWQQAQQNSQLMDKLLQQQDRQQQNNEQDQQQDDSQQQGQNQDGQQQNNSDGNNQGEQQGSQQEDNQPQQPSAEQQDKEQPSDESQNQAQPQSNSENAEQTSDPQQQQRSTQTEFADDIDPERAQQLEQWMNRIPDDPSILLRNKMLLESQRRNQRRASQPQGEPQKW